MRCASILPIFIYNDDIVHKVHRTNKQKNNNNKIKNAFTLYSIQPTLYNIGILGLSVLE